MTDILILLFHILVIKLKPMSEHNEQSNVIRWAEYSRKNYPCLNYLHSSLNGVKLSMGQAIKAKRSGLKAGVPDLHLPYNNGRYTSLYIEMKYGYNKPTTAQVAWMNWLEKQGAKCVVCYSAGDAIHEIMAYISLSKGGLN